jgi:transposase
MAQIRRKYTREFKVEAIALVESSGKSAAEVARDLGISKGNLCRWKKELDGQGDHAFPGHGHLAEDQSEIRKLQRENEILRQECEILKKAIAIFTRAKS